MEFHEVTSAKLLISTISSTARKGLISSRPIYHSDNVSTDGNYQSIAYGTVLWPTYATSASGLTEATLKKGRPLNLCQVIEDYRSSSALDVLGSIGGLLALLQGIHVFLFGRPLFWGLLGKHFIHSPCLIIHAHAS